MARRPDAPTARPAPPLAIGPERPARPPDMTTATKVRLRFGKRGDLRLVSHHDLMRCLERMLRRAAGADGHDPGLQPAAQDDLRAGPGPGDRGTPRGRGPRADRAVVAVRSAGTAGGVRARRLRVGRRAAAAARRRRAPAPVGRLRAAGAGGPPRGGPRRPLGSSCRPRAGP